VTPEAALTDLSQFSTGKVLINVRAETKSKEAADELESLLLAIQKNTKTSEPDCYTYRIGRFDNHFVVFEEYKDQAGVEFHRLSEPFKKYASRIEDLLVRPRESRFFREL